MFRSRSTNKSSIFALHIYIENHFDLKMQKKNNESDIGLKVFDAKISDLLAKNDHLEDLIFLDTFYI